MTPQKKTFVLSVLFLFIFIISFRSITNRDIEFKMYNYNYTRYLLDSKSEKNKLNNTKYILLYHKFARFSNKEIQILGDAIFRNCPVSNCFNTNNKKLMPIEKFDAIIINYRFLNFKKFSLNKRSPHQRYIIFNLEPPQNIKKEVYDGFYNWSMTYKFDSDFGSPYF